MTTADSSPVLRMPALRALVRYTAGLLVGEPMDRVLDELRRTVAQVHAYLEPAETRGGTVPGMARELSRVLGTLDRVAFALGAKTRSPRPRRAAARRHR